MSMYEVYKRGVCPICMRCIRERGVSYMCEVYKREVCVLYV